MNHLLKSFCPSLQAPSKCKTQTPKTILALLLPPSLNNSCPCLVPDPASHVRLINPKTVARTDDAIRLTDAATMRFARSKTSVSVPEVIDAFVHPETRTCCADRFFDGEDNASYGPYDSETAFNDGLVRALEARARNTWTERVVKFIRAMPEHGIVFTHNDWAPRNILVRDGHVVAILDWEFSGFYPDYWEFVKALCWPDWQSGWIKDSAI